MRHGYGVRKSAQHGVAAKFRSRSRTNASLTSLRSEYGEEDDKDEKKNYGTFFLLHTNFFSSNTEVSMNLHSYASIRLWWILHFPLNQGFCELHSICVENTESFFRFWLINQPRYCLFQQYFWQSYPNSPLHILAVWLQSHNGYPGITNSL